MNIITDNTIPYLKGIIEPVANVTYLNSGEFTAEAVKEADALIVRSVDKCSREILKDSLVKLITTATIGFDHIDIDYCNEVGIVWKNAPGSNAESVAEYILSSLFSLSLKTGETLKGKTIGIIGVGNVGKRVEHICKALGIKILRNDPPRAEKEGEEGFVPLSTIAQEADIITLHTPLTQKGAHPTYHLIDEAFFSSLQRSPWFINAARGSIHNTSALLAAKQEGKISHIILDCWENEPNISRELLSTVDIATPHIAGFSADGKANATRMCLENIRDFFGVAIDHIDRVIATSPSQPIIDLNLFQTNRLAQTILSCYDPKAIDRVLRQSPESFESLRANYPHPREFSAYTITGAEPNETALLRQLGFKC